MADLASRIALGIELAILVLLAGVLVVITAFSVMGLNDLTTVFYFIAFCVVCLALISTADVAFRRVRSGEIELPALRLRTGIAVGGAVIATGVTIYGQLYLSEHERWVQGLDFIGLGCFLWVPLLHLGALALADRAARQRLN
jgi:hypothetical protein